MGFINGILTAAATTTIMAPARPQSHADNLGRFNDTSFVDSLLSWAMANPIISAIVTACLIFVGLGIIALIILK